MNNQATTYEIRLVDEKWKKKKENLENMWSRYRLTISNYRTEKCNDEMNK